MNLEISIFLRKLLASLYEIGAYEIPFSGAEYNSGVRALQTALAEMLPEDQYDKISDVFIKTPVQEEYNHLQDVLMELNGDIIGYSSMENPYWRVLSIKMNPYLADKILNDQTSQIITKEQYYEMANQFCDAAGVYVWERS